MAGGQGWKAILMIFLLPSNPTVFQVDNLRNRYYVEFPRGRAMGVWGGGGRGYKFPIAVSLFFNSASTPSTTCSCAKMRSWPGQPAHTSAVLTFLAAVARNIFA